MSGSDDVAAKRTNYDIAFAALATTRARSRKVCNSPKSTLVGRKKRAVTHVAMDERVKRIPPKIATEGRGNTTAKQQKDKANCRNPNGRVLEACPDSYRRQCSLFVLMLVSSRRFNLAFQQAVAPIGQPLKVIRSE
jgi:hypothetical protein